MTKFYTTASIIFITSFTYLSSHVVICEKGLSYDDVLLVPQKTSLQSRTQASTKTRLTKKISLNIPIVSANMDTITESDMAIALAKLGGIGIIHRFNTISQQVAEVRKVKRYQNAVITDPLTITATATLGQAKKIMHDNNIKSLLVTDDACRLVGILTPRDIRFQQSDTVMVQDLMTPRERLVTGKVGISIPDAQKLLIQNGVEKLPLINDDWTVAGLITSKDILSRTANPNASLDVQGSLLVGAAIGIKDDSIQRAEALIHAGADVLVIDIAHGHSDVAIAFIAEIKKMFPTCEIIAGNVATAEGTRDLISAGADAVKVGIGPGSICTTRITTGSGYPQFSAVVNCAAEADKYNIPVIADGGIVYSGDVTKAIAAGASTVMLGSLLAGTEETPGIPVIKNGKKYKVIRGMASFGSNLGRQAVANDGTNPSTYVAEGVEALKPYKGNVSETVHQLIGGLRSGMSYCGVQSIQELRGNGVFVQITHSGIRESHPHDVMALGA